MKVVCDWSVTTIHIEANPLKWLTFEVPKGLLVSITATNRTKRSPNYVFRKSKAITKIIKYLLRNCLYKLRINFSTLTLFNLLPIVCYLLAFANYVLKQWVISRCSPLFLYFIELIIRRSALYKVFIKYAN